MSHPTSIESMRECVNNADPAEVYRLYKALQDSRSSSYQSSGDSRAEKYANDSRILVEPELIENYQQSKEELLELVDVLMLSLTKINDLIKRVHRQEPNDLPFVLGRVLEISDQSIKQAHSANIGGLRPLC